MKILANAKYYLNYLYFNRGDSIIRDYFSSNQYNNAIKELAEEGYLQTYLIFKDLVKIYSDQYPLNNEESLFISEVKNKFISNIKYPQNCENYLRLIDFTENFIGDYRISDIELGKEFKINFLKCELELYKKELSKTLPIFEAVVIRKFVKILLEKLIIKNIDIIDISGYFPNPTVLRNYQKSLASHYIFREGMDNNKSDDNINIETKIKEEIELADAYYEQAKKNKIKTNQKIVYKQENKITIIIETLFRMKNLCNKIVHFVDKSLVEYNNINDYIIDILNEPRNENTDINIKISIDKVSQFIAFGNPNQKLMNDLKDYYKKFSDDYDSLKNQKLSLPDIYNINRLNNYKEKILRAKEKTDEDLSQLVLSEYDLNLTGEDIDFISKFLNKNIFNLDDIQIDNILGINQRNKDELNYFNNLLIKMNIKQKLKFCMTFKENIEIINIKRKIDKIIPLLNKIEEIENRIRDFNDNYQRVLNSLKDEINKIKITTNFLKRDDIFTQISKNEFIAIINDLFKNERINFFDNEINNFYLFIYLLKKKIYDENSYKLALNISEDYI